MSGVDTASVRRLAAGDRVMRWESAMAVPALCDEVDALRAVIEQVRVRCAEVGYGVPSTPLAHGILALLSEPATTREGDKPEGVGRLPR